MKYQVCYLLAFLGMTTAAWADVVTLKNGDRITGTLITIKGGTLQLKSDILGTLSIPMAKVATYTISEPVALIMKGQHPLEGKLELEPSGDYEVTANGQAKTVPAAQADTIMPDADYQKLVTAAPKPWQAWKGAVNLGYALQNGNQQTDTLTTTISAVRERPTTPIFQNHWRTNFGFTTLISHAEEDDSTVTSHTLTATLREDYLVSTDNFLFVMGQGNHVSTQGLYLQQTYGGGYGRDLVSNARTVFSISTGPVYVQEKFFTGLLTQTAQLLVAEKLGEQFNKRVRLDHYFQFYPDLKNRGQYRFDTSSSLSLKLTTRFSANLTALDLYLSNPPAGNKSNDITFSAGLGYTF